MPPADRTGTALAGESAPEFANRMGLDPRAWKGLEGITDPLRLEAGARIDFSASLSLDAGLGVEVGATATVDPPNGPSGTARAPNGSGAGPVPAQSPADGTALTAAGGLSRALDRASAQVADVAAARTRDAFVGPAGSASTTLGPPVPSGTVAEQGRRTGVAAGGDVADPRAVSYGFGVPLRPRRGVAHAAAVGLVHERHQAIATGGDTPPVTDDPTVPAWRALARSEDATWAAGRGSCRCGCGGQR
jgi:hypothetical protein